jgi:hypothetical protein
MQRVWTALQCLGGPPPAVSSFSGGETVVSAGEQTKADIPLFREEFQFGNVRHPA